MTYPTSTADTLIIPVAPLGFTALGKALASTFVLPTASSEDPSSILANKYNIAEHIWRQACADLDRALHASELPLAVGIVQWVPLVVFAGPAWINMKAEQKQRRDVYTEFAKLQNTLFRPRRLWVKLHSHLIHHGRAGEQFCWLSISPGPTASTDLLSLESTLVFTGNNIDKDAKHISQMQSIYKDCEKKVLSRGN